MKTTITHAAIILADVPYNPNCSHVHFGKHYYVVVCNNACCCHSQTIHCIPMSSNSNRRLPVQVEVHAECFSKRTFALAEQLTILPRGILEEGRFCGILAASEMKKIHGAIRKQLAMD